VQRQGAASSFVRRFGDGLWSPGAAVGTHRRLGVRHKRRRQISGAISADASFMATVEAGALDQCRGIVTFVGFTCQGCPLAKVEGKGAMQNIPPNAKQKAPDDGLPDIDGNCLELGGMN
jgi:hypothetical protein